MQQCPKNENTSVAKNAKKKKNLGLVIYVTNFNIRKNNIR